MRLSSMVPVRTLSALVTFVLLVVVAACGQASSAPNAATGGPVIGASATPTVAAAQGPALDATASPVPATPEPGDPVAYASPEAPESATRGLSLSLTSEREDVYYPVFGTETHDIFEAIKANGPVSGEETEGHFTAGLAEYEATLQTQTRMSQGTCVIESGTVAVGFVVTLPRHEQYDSLSEELQVRWDGYERRVAAHEQRHVDIFRGVIDEVTVEIDELSGRFADCDALEAETNAAWDTAFERDRALQAGFHQEVARLSLDARGPIEDAIDANEARLDDLKTRLEGWSVESADLGAQVDAMDADIAVLVARLDEIEVAYPDLVLPEPLFGEYEALSGDAQTLIEARNNLASQHGDLVEAFNAATDEFNAINAANNELIEELNWQP